MNDCNKRYYETRKCRNWKKKNHLNYLLRYLRSQESTNTLSVN